MLYVLFLGTEYCERYAKKENITNSRGDEESGDEDDDISEGESGSSEDEIPGHADPWKVKKRV